MTREHDEPDGCTVDGCFEEAIYRGLCITHKKQAFPTIEEQTN